jgi:hypothetical protein
MAMTEQNPVPAIDEEDQDRRQIYIESGLTVDDPTAVAGLLARVSKDAEPTSAVDYNTRRSVGRKVDCAACGHVRNHYRGFLVSFADGSRALIGIECGEREFFSGGAWARLSTELERRKEAALYERRAAPTVVALNAILRMIDDWAEHASRADQFLLDFRKLFPELWIGLSRAAHRDGRLVREIRKQVSEPGRDGQLVERTIYIDEAIATLPCPDALTDRRATLRLTRLGRELSSACRSLETERAVKKQAEAFAVLRKARTSVIEAQTVYGLTLSQLSPEIWMKVATWARTDPGRQRNYRCNQRRFWRSDAIGADRELRLVATDTFPRSPADAILAAWPQI